MKPEHHIPVAIKGQSSRPRDYARPNSSWSPRTKELYDKYMTLSKDGGWIRLHSYNRFTDRYGMGSETDRKTRFFPRNFDEDGVGFEYSMFYNMAEMRGVCIFQPGPYLEGPPGHAHGGSIATIIDVVVGYVAGCSYGLVMTANLNINYRSPVLLGSTVIVESRVEKVEGRKIYTSCQVRSHDDAVLHAEATGLFIKINSKKSGAKL